MRDSAILGAALWLCAAVAAAAEPSVCRVPGVLDAALIRPLETGRSAVVGVGPYGALVSDPAWFANPRVSAAKPSSADLLAK